MTFYELVACDMHIADQMVSAEDYLTVIKRSKVWQYEWGMILADGQDMHIHILTNYRKKIFLRKPLRAAANYMFDHYDEIYTQILKKPEVLAFDLRMGWKLVKEDGLLYHLVMKKEDFNYV